MAEEAIPRTTITSPSAQPGQSDIQAEVFVYAGQQCIAKYSITHGEYLIGREVSCPVCLDVDGVSRHHARLTFHGYELLLEDLGSANGVFIEGVQIQLPTRVRPDQQVEIGSARLFIRLKSEASEMLEASLWDPDLGLAPVRALLEGKKYKVQAAIGGGGMGVVYQARDLRIRRTVAMKVIKTASQFSRENVLRFVDEAQLTGQLQHPNIIPLYDLALDEQGEVFYTMKFVKGITLDQVLRGIRKGDEEMIRRYPLATLLNVFQKICDGVAYAHSVGVVHRDLKPDNVMIGEYGEVLVMDWGLAKKIAHGLGDDHFGDAKPQPPPPDLRGFQTLNGLIVGTPPYIAPEAARGDLDQIDARSDIYVLGAILYAILTLRPPFPGKEFGELIEQIVSGRYIHPSSYNQPAKASRAPLPSNHSPDGNDYILAHLPGRRVDEGIAAIVTKAMSYPATDRYQTVAELQADLTAWQGGFAPKAERASLARHIWLWAQRHKGNVALFVIFAVLFHVAVIWFFLSLKSQRDIARASETAALESKRALAEALQDLQGAAPLFAEEARDLVKKKDLDLALDRIESAIRQLPNNAEYHYQRGQILQTLLRWDDAAEAFETALARNSKLPGAKENLDLTRKLIAETGEDHEPTSALIRDYHNALLKQGRLAEASALMEKVGADRPFASRVLRQAIENDPNLAPLRESLRRREMQGRFQRLPDGTYSANFGGLSLTTIQPFFRTQPVIISALVLDGVNLSDISILSGMKLRTLSLKNCRGITDLAPLEGMKLQRLSLANTGVRDIAVLGGMPLVELNLAECSRLTDVSPLRRCTQLEILLLPPKAQNIEFLRDMKSLKVLSFKNFTEPVADFWKARDRK